MAEHLPIMRPVVARPSCPPGVRPTRHNSSEFSRAFLAARYVFVALRIHHGGTLRPVLAASNPVSGLVLSHKQSLSDGCNRSVHPSTGSPTLRAGVSRLQPGPPLSEWREMALDFCVLQHTHPPCFGSISRSNVHAYTSTARALSTRDISFLRLHHKRPPRRGQVPKQPSMHKMFTNRPTRGPKRRIE